MASTFPVIEEQRAGNDSACSREMLALVSDRRERAQKYLLEQRLDDYPQYVAAKAHYTAMVEVEGELRRIAGKHYRFK